MATDYNDNKTPAELIPIFYEDHHLGSDGGQGSAVVKMDIVKGVYFFIPNFDARRKAVPWHDIHHLVTGYSAGTFIGECEISAWEIASGCRKYWAAFLIDTSGVYLGFFISPRKILQAYARGRRTTNFYHDMLSLEEVMKMPVNELKKILLLDQYPKETKPVLKDLISFAGFFIFAGVYSLLMILTLPVLLLFNIWMILKSKRISTKSNASQPRHY